MVGGLEGWPAVMVKSAEEYIGNSFILAFSCSGGIFLESVKRYRASFPTVW
jgi:hypothetical protein